VRRKEKAMTTKADMEALIGESRVCHVGLCDNGHPYVVPLHFGYIDGTIYLHAAPEGRKLTVMAENPSVCIVFDICDGVIPADKACGWSTAYRSVMAFGEAELVTDPAEKQKGLGAIVSQYGGDPDSMGPRSIDATTVIRVRVRELTGKVSGGAPPTT